MASGKRDPQPGDLIEINRGVYQHWALYLGDGYVIHVTAEDEGIPRPSAGSVAVVTRRAKVKKQLLRDVVGTDDWKVNNKYDRSHTPRPVKEIIRQAERYIDTERTYRLLYSNCEHFVTMLRYGEEISEQGKSGSFFTSEVVDSAVASVGAVALTVCGVGPVAAAGVMIGAATVGCVAGAVANLRSSGRHSGNQRQNN